MPIYMSYGSDRGDVGSSGKGQVHGMRLGSKTITPRTLLQVIGDAQLHGGQAGFGSDKSIHAYQYSLSGQSGSSSHPTGKRQHPPFTIIKEVDQTSPAMYQAAAAGMTGNRPTPKLHINFYKTSAQGKPQHYFTIILTDAALGGIRRMPHHATDRVEYRAGGNPVILKALPPHPSRHSNPRTHELEEISLTFAKIEVTWTSGAGAASDDWNP